MPTHDILDDIFLQPWFLSLETANAIRNLIPPEYRHKMRYYFDDYGCLHCGKMGLRYGANAMCKPCLQSVKLKMLFAIKRRWKERNPTERPRTFKRAAEARRLLADLIYCPDRDS